MVSVVDVNKPIIKLFLSYAHADEGDTADVTEFLTELNKCFKASKHFHYALWADRDLLIGDDWHEKITGSLADCDYGLMLVSLSFITSDYIREHELPDLLASGRALPVGFQKIDLDWFDAQGITPKQVFYHQQQFYGEFAAKSQGRADFVQALVKAIETKFLKEHKQQLTTSVTESVSSDVVKSAKPSPADTKKTDITDNYLAWGFVGLLVVTFLIAGLSAYWGKARTDDAVKLMDDLTLVPIPAGQFSMGNAEFVHERPVHTVTFDQPFWISATEITFDQYAVYVQAQQKPLPDDESWGREGRPVINVSWHDAKAYATWLSAANEKGLQCRLPSEAEWEYAARAGSRAAYAWGEQIGTNNAHCRGCGSRWEGQNNTVPVARFPENAWGVFDMHGNVAEWVADIWHTDYQGAPQDGAVWHSGGNAARRVVRGGSWADEPRALGSAPRASYEATGRYNFVGFRVVCTLP